MTLQELLDLAGRAAQDPESPLPEPEAAGEFSGLAALLGELITRNRGLREERQAAFAYIRGKIDQLLGVIGTVPLRPEELDDKTLVALDPIGIISQSFTQILEHLRQTNEKLELAMEEIQAIFEAVGGGILVLDSERRILAFNNKFEEMFTREDEEPLGLVCREVTCRGEEPEDGCPFGRMLESGRAVVVPDWPFGGRHYSVIATPVKDQQGDIVRGVLLYLDISELMAAKAAVVEERERLAKTLASIAEGVIATDTNGAVTMMNRVAEELTGLRFSEAWGKRVCSVLQILEEGSGRSCAEWFQAVLEGGGVAERKANTILIADDGTERLINISAAPISGRDETTAGSIIVFRDITQERRVEEELAKNTRIDSLGVMAGGIAHDFNNLLAGILGNIGLAKLDAGTDSPIREQLGNAEKACLRAQSLTQQLLTFSRGGDPVKKPFALGRVIKENVEFALRGSKVSSEIVIQEGLWAVEADEGQISQVLNNLVINANQAMPQGGKIKVLADNVTIGPDNPLPIVSGKYVRVAVIDQGIGIQPEHLGRIFDPYFTTKQTGSGLGLASCFTILKRHEGFLDVVSQLGKGATFTFYLPATEAQLRPEAEPEAALEKRGTGKILVMDDDEAIRRFVKELLSRFGFKTEVAADGQAAIDLYKQAKAQGEPYDVVIMDLTVPGGMGGQEAIGRLLEFDPQVKAVVSSGYSNDAAMADFRKYGFQAVIPKPYEVRSMVKIIQEILAR